MRLTKPILKANRVGTGDRVADRGPEVMRFMLRASRQECSDGGRRAAPVCSAFGCGLSPTSCRSPPRTARPVWITCRRLDLGLLQATLQARLYLLSGRRPPTWNFSGGTKEQVVI
jgi:hypothetical protein